MTSAEKPKPRGSTAAIIWKILSPARICATERRKPDCGVSEQIALQFAKAKQHHTGIALKGIEALELRYKGYTGKEIAALYHTSPKSVFSWISRAKQKLRQNGELEALLACCK